VCATVSQKELKILQLSLNETCLQLHTMMDQFEDIDRIRKVAEFYKGKVNKKRERAYYQ